MAPLEIITPLEIPDMTKASLDTQTPGSEPGMPSISNILSTDDPITVIDIGAALIGEEVPPYQSLIEAGLARLVAFEPDAEALPLLRERFPPPSLCLPLFVGDGRTHTYYETNWGPTGSLFEPNTPLLEKFHNLPDIARVVRTHEVDTVRLDDITEISDVDLIKIDAQGAEAMIFENAKRILSSVTVVHAEVSWVELYKGIPLCGDVDRVLRSLGFQWHTCLGVGQRPFLPILNPDHPQLAFKQELWGNVVFVRDWMNLDDVPSSKLIKMAVILHDLYKSYDLAHHAFCAADRQSGTNFAENYSEWMTSE